MSESVTSEITNQPQKIGRFRRSLELTKSAWRVLKLEKGLVAVPLWGMFAELIIFLVVAAGFLAVVFGLNSGTFNDLNISRNWFLIPFALLALGFTFVSSLVAGIIVHGALERFKGNDPTLKSCFAAAYSKKGSLFLFSLLSTTIGLVLRLIEERVPLGGKIAGWILGATWSIASMFAIPFVMTAGGSLGPIQATKESANLVKKVWGESFIVSGGIGIIAILSSLGYILVFIPLIVLAAQAGAVAAGFTIGIGMLGLFALVLVLSVLGSIAQAAVFYWATTGKAPETFNRDLLQAALTPKKARKIFA